MSEGNPTYIRIHYFQIFFETFRGENKEFDPFKHWEWAEARRTTILQPVEQKPHSQKDRQNEKTEDYVQEEGTR